VDVLVAFKATAQRRADDEVVTPPLPIVNYTWEYAENSYRIWQEDQKAGTKPQADSGRNFNNRKTSSIGPATGPRPDCFLSANSSDLFVLDWSVNTDQAFPLYFHACQPSHCTYQVQEKGVSLLALLSLLLGALGGLSVALRTLMVAVGAIVQQPTTETGRELPLHPPYHELKERS
jgi:hypothetical protein